MHGDNLGSLQLPEIELQRDLSELQLNHLLLQLHPAQLQP